MKKAEVQTADGICPIYIHMPGGEGPWPGIIMYMDAPGIRPAMQELAERLAQSGYAILLPDFFYRSGAYEPVDPKRVFVDPVLREAHREKFTAPATPARVMADTAAILDFAETLPEVEKSSLGVVGYCMGGRLALIAAGTYPDRIAAAASYHGGGLANDTPSSPHLLAPKIKAKIYVAGAIEDVNFDDAMKQRLIDAFTQAGVEHLVETYPAKHGWVPRDMPAHDAAEAEHHWRTLIAFMDRVLKA